jgi:hypothetical protein
MTVPARAPVLLGGPIVISIVGKSRGSTALVMENVPVPLSGTRNVPAEPASRCCGLRYQHSYHREAPRFFRPDTVKVMSQLPEASC